MKRTKLIGIIFYLIVCISIGIAAYSDINQQTYNSEQSSVADNLTNSLSSHHESVTEDQIDQPDKYIEITESPGHLPDSRNCSKVFNFCLSIWQPPKIF